MDCIRKEPVLIAPNHQEDACVPADSWTVAHDRVAVSVVRHGASVHLADFTHRRLDRVMDVTQRVHGEVTQRVR